MCRIQASPVRFGDAFSYVLSWNSTSYAIPGVMQMECAWKEFLAIVPGGIRSEVDEAGKEKLQELRLRINAPPELVLADGSIWLDRKMTQEDLNFVVNTATRYSPWTAASTAQGFITAPGGHRIGLCGDTVTKSGFVTGFRTVRSLCIRVARDFFGIGKAAAAFNTSVLILGAPGTGKTTLLRDLARQLAYNRHVAVVDERCELFPEGFSQGRCQDTILGCSKEQGIDMVIRTMGPEFLAVDEITAEADSVALVRAAYCGVHLLATAHAGCLEDFSRRNVYRPLREAHVFNIVLILDRNKLFTVERMTP